LRDKGELIKAIADYNRALEINPTAAKAYANRGLARLLQEDAAAAEQDFAAALNLDRSLLALIEQQARAIKERLKKRQ
jgi:tetratricopeptide (TPR) repeat protein